MKHAREIINVLFDEKKAKEAQSWSSLFSGWNRAAGDDIAAHSRVTDVRNGTVVVEVDHPGWLQMVRMKDRQILRTLKKNYPELNLTSVNIYCSGKPQGIPQDESAKQPPRAANEEEVSRVRGTESPEYREFQGLLERMRDLGEKK